LRYCTTLTRLFLSARYNEIVNNIIVFKITVNPFGMNILAIETSTTACSVALLAGGIFERHEDEANQHSAKMMGLIEQLLLEAKLARQAIQCIAIGIGPGSFTGVRIACGVGQSMAYALNISVVPVLSTEMVAHRAMQHGYETVWVALDARLGELYVAGYSVTKEANTQPFQAKLEPQIMRPEEFAELLESQTQGCGAERICAAGNGFTAFPELLSAAGGLATFSSITPNARAAAEIAQASHQHRAVEASLIAPVYLRNKVAQTIEERAALRVQTAVASSPK
jgi:tRNA threonylcarbamoyladenosine biosynthesis protein TsaB